MRNIGTANTLVKSSPKAGAGALVFTIVRAKMQKKTTLLLTLDENMSKDLLACSEDGNLDNIIITDSVQYFCKALVEIKAYSSCDCLVVVDSLSIFAKEDRKHVLDALAVLSETNKDAVLLVTTQVDMLSRSVHGGIRNYLHLFSFAYDLYVLESKYILEQITTHEREELPMSAWVSSRDSSRRSL